MQTDQRLAVGAPYDNGSSNTTNSTGAVHLFSFSNSSFSNPSLSQSIGSGYSGLNFSSYLDDYDYFGLSVPFLIMLAALLLEPRVMMDLRIVLVIQVLFIFLVFLIQALVLHHT